MQRRNRKASRPNTGTTGKLELLASGNIPEDKDVEHQMPEVQKDSHQAYETAGRGSIMDYFLLRAHLFWTARQPVPNCTALQNFGVLPFCHITHGC